MDLPKVVLSVFLIFSEIRGSFQESAVFQKETQTLFHQLLDTYDSRIRPAGPNQTDGPVEITINVAVRAITSFSDYDMDFGVQVIIRQEWHDERLKYESKANLKYLTLVDTSKVWTPDLFVLNEKDGHLHKLTTPNTFLRIYPTGQVLYSTRLSLTLWCQMQLERFPFDNQQCSIILASYGYSGEDVRLRWREINAVQVSGQASVTGFTMGAEAHSESNQSTSTGQYSSLKMELLFQRDLTYYILHTFLPSVVLVVISWTSFWMDQAIVSRIFLVLSTLFAMSSLTADVESSIPHVAYVKAMDIWTGVCFTFLLTALIELVVVNASLHDKKPPIAEGKDENTVKKPTTVKTSDSHQENDTSKPARSLFQRLTSQIPTDPSRIDAIARVFLPPLFLIFVALYFFVYFIMASSTTNCSL